MNRPPTGSPSLRALLDESLDLGFHEREAFLARLRLTHPESALQLERLLAAESELDARSVETPQVQAPRQSQGRLR